MKHKGILYILSLLVLPIIFLHILPESSSLIPISSSSLEPRGISKYSINNYVTYNVEINITLNQISGKDITYHFKYARMNDRYPENPLTKETPEYQRSRLLYHNITGYTEGQYMENHTDKFHNTYDSFNATITGEGTMKFSQKYEITLNSIIFNAINFGDYVPYDTSDPIFDLFCNRSEQYFEINDPDLIGLSNSICRGVTNPFFKAKIIFEWIQNNIQYDNNMPFREIGASNAYDNLRGDCSEYSNLMVTLLRIQGIPARKVTGVSICTDVPFYPKVGDVYKYDLFCTQSTGFTGSNPPYGHAYVEYYIKGIGWIQCDPTWSSGSFNSNGYQSLTYNIGAHFFYPPNDERSEFSNPIFLKCAGEANYSFDYKLKITVVGTDVAPEGELWIIIVPFISLILIVGFTGLIWKKKRRTFER